MHVQAELAQHLDVMGHLISATPETLLHAIKALDTAKMVPYQKGNPSGIVAEVDRIMGVA